MSLTRYNVMASLKERGADHGLTPEGTWQILLFKGSGPNTVLSISLAKSRDRSVVILGFVILGLVENGALESDLSFGLTSPRCGYVGDMLV